MERKHLLSHLAHVELLTPKLEESVKFFKDVIGLEESARAGHSVYLRCWGEFYHHSVILTQSDQTGIGHSAWRTLGPRQLEEAVASLEAAGVQGQWLEQSLGHGRAYRFRGPGGHVHEVFWEIERYVAPPELQSSYSERPQRYTGRGIAPRQIDHVTLNAANGIMESCTWYRDTLGFRFMGYVSMEEDPNTIVFGVVTTNEKAHDMGFNADFSGVPGRLHHLAFFVETHDELLRAANILLEAGTPIEVGPGRHGIGEQDYLYFREPSGIRIEMNASGYRNYIPDWEPVHWKPSQGANSFYRNIESPMIFYYEAFPPLSEEQVAAMQKARGKWTHI